MPVWVLTLSPTSHGSVNVFAYLFLPTRKMPSSQMVLMGMTACTDFGTKILFSPDNLYYEAMKPTLEAHEKGLPLIQSVIRHRDKDGLLKIRLVQAAVVDGGYSSENTLPISRTAWWRSFRCFLAVVSRASVSLSSCSLLSAVCTIVRTANIILWSRVVKSSRNSLLSFRCCSKS